MSALRSSRLLGAVGRNEVIYLRVFHSRCPQYSQKYNTLSQNTDFIYQI
jgi:hypothetical protein